MSHDPLDDAPLLPSLSTGWLSRFSFSWVFALIRTGYSRPLEAEDLYRLDTSQSPEAWGQRLMIAIERQAAQRSMSKSRRIRIQNNFWASLGWNQKDPNLMAALYKVCRTEFWIVFAMKIIADGCMMCSPLVLKAIIKYIAASHTSDDRPSLTHGLLLTILLLALQVTAAVLTQHIFHRTFRTAILVRSGLISLIHTQALHLTNRSRSIYPSGKLVTLISSDVTRVQNFIETVPLPLGAPVQIVVCLTLLYWMMGLPSLAAFMLIVVGLVPLRWMTGALKQMRNKSVQWTGKRIELIQEMLGNALTVKLFAWETPFLKRISQARESEIKYIRQRLLIRALFNSLAWSVPNLATVMGIIIYIAAHPGADASILFPSLSLFQLLRLPLLWLPGGLSAWVDGSQALNRIADVLEAETILTDKDIKTIDPNLTSAIHVQDASFVWDGVYADDVHDGVGFEVKDINMDIPRGSLVAIVGPVGSGKSSLLQGLVGDMRRSNGSVTFGGPVAYCAQTSWIQNASIRENITFGSRNHFDQSHYNYALHASSLITDLSTFPSGDETLVGEKGVQLSGGQKQRLSIARALYASAGPSLLLNGDDAGKNGANVILFDDVLSALDATVGRKVFERAILDNGKDGKGNTTRILVTHALHFLPEVDYIYVMEHGRIVERGTYEDLVRNGARFEEMVRSLATQSEGGKEAKVVTAVAQRANLEEERPRLLKPAELMQAEERGVGSVSARVYKDYFVAGRGPALILPFLIILVLSQISTIMLSYWLVFWSERKFPQSDGFYMGIYAGFGFGQAVLIFALNGVFTSFVYETSKNLHEAAIQRILTAPMAFFDTTPLGRIMNRFSRDIDTIDNLMMILQSLNLLAGFVSGIALISAILPLFSIIGTLMILLFYWAGLFYRPSVREIKRIDALLRSKLYASLGESLSGLTTIRAYGATQRILAETRNNIDIENRALWAFEVTRRWLGIRLDTAGPVMSFAVAILVVLNRSGTSSAQAGLVMSYIMSVQQTITSMVRSVVDVESNMNSVERILHYAHEVEQEAPHENQGFQPSSAWPTEGRLEFKNVIMAYREGLEPTLKNISFAIEAGEKVGIVGRTGAGKSSILVALYRIVELAQGSITIDDVDIAKLGLHMLRSRIAIIPQEPGLVTGTIRSNLDPFEEYDDATLWDAIEKSHLRQSLSTGHEVEGMDRVSLLESPVDAGGSNLSVGQRSLVSLARALLKDSRIIVLDEATASVDSSIDQLLQQLILHKFQDHTVLCIAHRIRTVIGYDKVLVMDGGRISEFGTPSKLFEKGGIFTAMCEHSSLSLEDMKEARSR